MQQPNLLQYIADQLTSVYAPGEAKAIARIVAEDYLGVSMLDIYTGKVTQINAEMQKELQNILGRLMKKEPVQYVVGKALFMGNEFCVNPDVLIPRPETEELVNWVVTDVSKKDLSVQIVDIGTGSGCIAIMLALLINEAKVKGWDVSDAALGIAATNAGRMKATVDFEHFDVLQPPSDLKKHGMFDVIVSNPPYIWRSERSEMDGNVTHYEPSLALFVDDDDPFLFYRAIARLGHILLQPRGAIYFEINERLGNETVDLLRSEGYGEVELRKDIYGRDRMIKAML